MPAPPQLHLTHRHIHNLSPQNENAFASVVDVVFIDGAERRNGTLQGIKLEAAYSLTVGQICSLLLKCA